MSQKDKRVKNIFDIWLKLLLKTSKPEGGNRYPGIGSTESPKQNESKQTHTMTYHN